MHAMVEVETAEQVVDALDRAVANNIHISANEIEFDILKLR